MAKRRPAKVPSGASTLDPSLLGALGVDPSVISDLQYLDPSFRAPRPGARPRPLSAAKFAGLYPEGLTPEGLNFEQQQAQFQQQLAEWQRAQQLFRQGAQRQAFGQSAQSQVFDLLSNLGNIGQSAPGQGVFNPVGGRVGFQAEQFARGLQQAPLQALLGGGQQQITQQPGMFGQQQPQQQQFPLTTQPFLLY